MRAGQASSQKKHTHTHTRTHTHVLTLLISVKKDGLGKTIANGWLVGGAIRVCRVFNDCWKGDGGKINPYVVQEEDYDGQEAVVVHWDPKKVTESEVAEAAIDLLEEIVAEIFEPAKVEVKNDFEREAEEMRKARLAEIEREKRVHDLTVELMGGGVDGVAESDVGDIPLSSTKSR